MSNIHTIAEFNNDRPNNRPMPNAWGTTGAGGNDQRSASTRRTGTQMDDTYWSHNLKEGEPYQWYHIILNCFCPCFIGPLCSDVRKKDYLALLYQSLFWIFWIDLVYFIVEIAFGFNPFDFIIAFNTDWAGSNTVILQNLGAKYAPEIRKGHVWRLITPIFMHGGLMHFFFNMFVQLGMGLGFERRWWFFRMLPIYFISGIFGNLVSSTIYYGTTGVGASGAILGFLFAKISNVICRWKLLLPYERISHVTSIVTIVLFSIIMSFGQNVDWTAHLGGAVMGFVLGFVAFANYFKNQYVKWIVFVAGIIIAFVLYLTFFLLFFLIYPYPA